VRWPGCVRGAITAALNFLLLFLSKRKSKKETASRQKENKEASEEKETMNCISSYNKENWLPFDSAIRKAQPVIASL